ncbi:nucleotide sugar dehydrogenase [Azorhizobium sp. AG788]|uniref:nucleotide sugar dehydrogenase n=1 Tax=Azorhizobium sp. AG788 TaxID=2183897 RepID=UPI003138C976
MVYDSSAVPGAALADILMDRIEAQTIHVGVIGLGYVGLPLMIAFADRGIRVTGFDIDPVKIDHIRAGRSYFRHIGDDAAGRLRAAEQCDATTDFSRLADADIILVCVPTPLTHHREPDMGFVVGTTQTIAAHLRAGQMVVLESTVYPGATAEVMRPILEQGGLRCGRDFFLAYSPEREDPGNPDYDTRRIPKVVGADDPDALRVAIALYRRIVSEVVPVSSLATAEAVKLTENIFRAVNIALVNELKLVYAAMGIDIWEVVAAAKTKPFGYMPFYPGPGLGGHCIPIDPFYLTWKAHAYGISTRFIELAGEINTAMPGYVVDLLARTLDDRSGRGLNGARILVVGIAYKKNIDDTRESPALRIIRLLEARKATVLFHDPLVPVIPSTREYPELAGRQSLALTADDLAACDAALIVTDHDAIDYQQLVDACPLVVDTRNACAVRGIRSERIAKA